MATKKKQPNADSTEYKIPKTLLIRLSLVERMKNLPRGEQGSFVNEAIEKLLNERGIK